MNYMFVRNVKKGQMIMTTFNFSAVNVTYMLESQRLIREDRTMAKLLLRIPDELFDFIENLTQDQINTIGQMKAPIPTLNINQKILKEFMNACRSEKHSIDQFNDRLMTANA